MLKGYDFIPDGLPFPDTKLKYRGVDTFDAVIPKLIRASQLQGILLYTSYYSNDLIDSIKNSPLRFLYFPDPLVARDKNMLESLAINNPNLVEIGVGYYRHVIFTVEKKINVVHGPQKHTTNFQSISAHK